MKDEGSAGSEPVARASSPPGVDSAPSFSSGQDARATMVHRINLCLSVVSEIINL